MGHMKDFDRRIRQGGDDAIAAVSEYVAALRITAAERQAIEVACEDLRHEEEVATLRGLLQRMDCAQSPRWIPVSERLPKKDEPVLACWVPRKDGMACAMVRNLNGKVCWTPADQWTECDPPKCWMPLPEPPEVK